jgi:uncharacterized protein (UPF0303 family)
VSQTTDLIARIEEQERNLVFPSFDNEDAWRLGNLLVELARARNASVTIDIRRNGQQLFHCALTGTSVDNDFWLQRKSRTVDRFGQSSFLVGLGYAARGTSFEEASHLDLATYAGHGGAFPINVAGVGLVGTVGVSGLAQAEDHELIVAALESYLGKPSSAKH